jgi:hypothetical protein
LETNLRSELDLEKHSAMSVTEVYKRRGQLCMSASDHNRSQEPSPAPTNLETMAIAQVSVKQ